MNCHRDDFFHESLHIRSFGYRGRSVFAHTNISPGELVIREAPLACVPLVSSPSPFISLDHGLYAANHVEESMLKFSASKGFHGVGRTSILAARCLIAVAQCVATQPWWEALVFHEPASECLNENVLASVDILQRLLLHSAPTLATTYHREDLRIALLKLAANSFTIVTEDLEECGHGVYAKVSAINHSCQPNCLQWFDESGKIFIRTIRQILGGEEITISYLDISRPTWWRRAELRHYGFNCICDRCCETENYEGYSCATNGCTGTMYYKERRNTKYLYKIWLNGRVPTVPSAEEVQESIRSCDIPLPLLDTLTASAKRENSQYDNFYCGNCKTTVSFSSTRARLKHFINQFVDIRDKINEYSSEMEDVLVSFKAAKSIVHLAEPLLHVKHSSFIECQSILINAYEKMLKIQSKPNFNNSWFTIVKEYIELANQYHRNNSLLFSCLHPIPLLNELKYLENCINVTEALILEDLQEIRWTKSSWERKGSVLLVDQDASECCQLIIHTLRHYIAQYQKMKNNMHICFGSSHRHLKRLDVANERSTSLEYKLASLQATIAL